MTVKAVLDTNVLVRARGDGFGKVVLTPGIIEEVESQQGRNVLNSMDYSVSEPSESALKQVQELSEDINSPTSETDEAAVALALDIEAKLVTDDKAMQNLCLHLEIDFEGFMDEKLDQMLEWELKCSNCGSEVSPPRCPRCGSRDLDRRQVRSS